MSFIESLTTTGEIMPRIVLGMKKIMVVTMRMRSIREVGKRYPAMIFVAGEMRRVVMPEISSSHPRVFL